MVKNYLELNKNEKYNLIEFIHKNEKNILSLEKLDEMFVSEDYDFGNGILLKVHNENISGKVFVILKECKVKKTAYILKLQINEKSDNKENIIIELLDEAKKTAINYGTLKIYFGTNKVDVINVLNNKNIYKQYSAVKMILDDRKIKYTTLKLEKLSENNKIDYMIINNDAFLEVPNGGSVSEREVDEFIKKSDENNYCFIAKINENNAGILQFNIVDGVGEFDLGLIKNLRGKGYGKHLLETAIDFLNYKEVKEIVLTVITKNTIAYEMYKKRGFREKETISDWFEIL